MSKTEIIWVRKMTGQFRIARDGRILRATRNAPLGTCFGVQPGNRQERTYDVTRMVQTKIPSLPRPSAHLKWFVVDGKDAHRLWTYTNVLILTQLILHLLHFHSVIPIY